MIHALLLLASASQAAPAAGAQCPKLGVESEAAADGTVFRITAEPIPEGNFTFNWVISAGTIAEGQGSGNIRVEAPKGSFVTATVEVGGLPAECSPMVSGSTEID
jgi:hypothetical protein